MPKRKPLIELTDGDIDLGERLVNDLDPKDRDVAMVFQNHALYPSKTVYRVALGRALVRDPRSRRWSIPSSRAASAARP